MGFNFGGDSNPTDGLKEPKKVEKDYEVLEDRVIGHPHLMGLLYLLAEDDEAGITGDDKEESFEADKWEEVWDR